MSDTFFCRKAEFQIKELVEDLYKRLDNTRRLLTMYDSDCDCSDKDRGYAQGIREEIGYLVRLLDKYERS